MKSLLALPLLLFACGVPLDIEGGDYKESEVYKKSMDDLWKTSITTLENKGYKLKTQDKTLGRIETEWRLHLDPRWRSGDRQRAQLEILPQPDKKYKIRVRVLREVNDNGKDPLSEKEAIWVDAGGNDTARDELLYLIHLKIKGLGLDD